MNPYIDADGFTIDLEEPRNPDRLDSMWWTWDNQCHQLVGSVGRGDYLIGIYADGEMRVHIWEDAASKHKDHNFSVVRYCDDLEEHFITDKQVFDAGSRTEWVNNSWFDLYDLSNDGEHIDYICDDLDAAIGNAKDLILLAETRGVSLASHLDMM